MDGNRTVVGKLRGYDQFMNLVLEEAVDNNSDEKAPLGQVVIRGNSVVQLEVLPWDPEELLLNFRRMLKGDF